MVAFKRNVACAVGLLLLGASAAATAQNTNPPYPRFGIFTFSGSYEACLDILKDFDIIAFPTNNDMARKYKAQNPDVILLACNAGFIEYETNFVFPEAWYYHDTAGNRFKLWEGCYMMNITSYCPKVDLGDGNGPVTFNECQIKKIAKNIDLNYYDGIFHDWWWNTPGYDARMGGDLNSNGIVDKDEWGGADSVNAVWWRGLLDFHAREYTVPNLKYVVVQLGGAGIWPYVNGACFEDWPMYNGPFDYWRTRYNDSITGYNAYGSPLAKQPRLMMLDASHRFFNYAYPATPYKNNYRAVRYALGAALLTSSYFFVDEGNDLGHHGNVHIYDEFEAKGKLGYPRSDMIMLPGKSKAGVNFATGVWVRFFDYGVSLVNASGITQTVTSAELAALDPVAGSRYYRFSGGQDPDFNNGQEVTTPVPLTLWGDTHMANWSEPEVFGDGAMLFRTRKTLVTPIVVDNNANNQTSPGSDPVQYAGSWVPGSDGKKCYAVYDDRNYAVFQSASFAWSSAGSGENTATYTPTIGVPGVYEVFEWHGYRGGAPGSYSQATNAKVQVLFDGTIDTTIFVDQTTGYGRWNSLGLYYFSKGKTGRVVLSNAANASVLSDAVQFVYRRSSWEADITAPGSPQNVKVTTVH
jgi:hypothetical protein